MRRRDWVEALSLSTVIAACGGGHQNSRLESEAAPVVAAGVPTASPANAPSPSLQAAEPPASSGCRSPEEPGCATCCRPLDGTGCTVMQWFGGGVTGVTPWYNSLSAATPCPASCPRCAKCSARDEVNLRSLDQKKCDCSGPPEPQACDVTGCGCYCSNLYNLRLACPHLAE